MNVSYLSVKIDGSVDALTSYLKKQNDKTEIKKITDTMVFLQFQGPPPYNDLVSLDTSRGFYIQECSQIKDSDWKNDGFELINKIELEDKVELTEEEKKQNEENEKTFNNISKIMNDTVLPSKCPLQDNDPFLLLSSKYYVFRFVFGCLVMILLLNIFKLKIQS